MTTIELEKRLNAVEEELASLKAEIAATPRDRINWVEEIAGTFANDPLLDEAVRLGREWRKSDPFKPSRAKRQRAAKSGHKRK